MGKVTPKMRRYDDEDDFQHEARKRMVHAQKRAKKDSCEQRFAEMEAREVRRAS